MCFTFGGLGAPLARADVTSGVRVLTALEGLAIPWGDVMRSGVSGELTTAEDVRRACSSVDRADLPRAPRGARLRLSPLSHAPMRWCGQITVSLEFSDSE